MVFWLLRTRIYDLPKVLVRKPAEYGNNPMLVLFTTQHGNLFVGGGGICRYDGKLFVMQQKAHESIMRFGQLWKIKLATFRWALGTRDFFDMTEKLVKVFPNRCKQY